MQLVYTIGVLVAVINRIACQGPIVTADAGQNLLTNIVLSTTVKRIAPVVGGQLPDARMPPPEGINLPTNVGISSTDGNISPAGGTVSLPDGRSTPVDRRLAAIQRRVAPVDRSGSLPDGRISPREGNILAVEQRIAPVDGNVLPSNDIISVVDQKIIAADTPIDGTVLRSDANISPVDPLIDRNVLPSDGKNLPVDRRLSAVERIVSPVDGNVLLPDANISPVDQNNSPVDPPIDMSVASVALPDGITLPVDRRLSAVERIVSPVDGNVLLPDANISPVDQKKSPVDPPIDVSVARVTLPDGRTLPVDRRLSAVERIVSPIDPPIDVSVALPDGRTLPVDRRLSAVERIVSPIDGNVLMPKANTSPVNQKMLAVDPPIDTSVALPDGRTLPVDPRLTLPDGTLSGADLSSSLPGMSIAPIDRSGSPSGGKIAPIDLSGSLPGERITSFDRGSSLTGRSIVPDNRIGSLSGRRISTGDGGILGVDGNISPIDGRLSPIDRIKALSQGPDRSITPIDQSGSLPGGRITSVDRVGSLTGRSIVPVDRSGSLSGGRIAAGDAGILAVDGNFSPTGGRTLAIDGRLSPIDRMNVISHGPDDPMFVYEECKKAACAYPSLCYIPHPRDCFRFIMCKPLETGQIVSQAMPCAFGTKWKPGSEPACERFDLVDCPNDKCRFGMTTAYKHDDRNCRTYWKCVNGRSRAACCAKYHSFDPRSNKCVSDIGCDSVCPLLNDATCWAPGVQFANFADGNCLTHWDCENGHPHPVCCPSGQGYDVFLSTCVQDPSCTHTCPKEYSESCSIPGTKAYDLVDKNCRTFIKCNKHGQSDPYCCLPGSMYDAKTKRCVRAKGRNCVNSDCPYGFLEECNLEEVPGNRGVYKNLDAFGGIEMPCPVGTVFNVTGCQCSPDVQSPYPSPTPTHCTMAIDAKFPNLKNLGTAVAALLMIGDYGQGERGVGNMINFWDGGAGINIPFYGSQSLHNIYLEARFRPTAGSYNKQVFVTSCNYVGGVPTFEVSLDKFQGRGGIIKLVAKTDGVPGLAEISFPFNFNDEILLRVMYDGTKIGLFVDSSNPAMSNSAVRPLSGLAAIHRSGLRFTHCRYENNVSGLIGYVSEIKFTKCLTSQMQGALDAATPAV